MTRVYDAPVALVWQAWTEAQHLAQWWGPRGFTITTHARDCRVGGTWVYTMHGPDGTDYPNFTRYLEVEPRAKLVYDHGARSEDAAPMFRVTATFTDLGDKTVLDMRMAFATEEAALQSRAIIKAAGGYTTWDRLAEFLEQRASAREIFVMARSVEAPIDVVFDLWALPEHLVHWLPPAGFAMTFRHADIRPGGEAAFAMTSDAFTMHGLFRYVTVDRPSRLEYVQCFTTADGTLARHPGAPSWPEWMRTSVHFAAEGPSTTRVTVRSSVEGAATAEEIAAFVAERGGMTRGWTGSFDALDAMVAGTPTGA
ncbi:MAG: SRPBCC domain-containing protein [Gemmatimonadaceae bacterium]|nr:SRPBCC domain-containing protein [Gemmatimonadaceae bacterium]